MVRIGIIGATGAVGEALIRILLGHPEAQLAVLGSDHAAGERIDAALPVLRGQLDAVCRKPELDAFAAECDVVFMAKKGPEAMEWAPRLLEAGLKVIDHGGEFRFRDPAIYEAAYGRKHACPELLEQAVFGLPELYRDEIAAARLVGNPGCYPTGAILPLAPLLAEGLIEPQGIVVDSCSGLSGAGRQYSAKARNLFLDCQENCRAYCPLTHRHAPEMEQELSAAAGVVTTVVFVPHLIPVDRGILTTAFARLSRPAAAAEVLALWRGRYAEEPFLRIVEDPSDVELAYVRRTNYCDVSAAVDPRTDTLVVVSALDNVIKGACGMAVQNMNLMTGLDETAGLHYRCI
ncbi:MAG: N-acetyl-gamma-glutamyl-phosphate reductase [Planctomycetota bacterium]